MNWKAIQITQKNPTYECIWIFTKIKMCTSRTDHRYNGYYYVGMAIRNIFCLRKG